MKKFIYIILVLLLACSCEDRVIVLFDTPFVSITDEGGSATSMTVPAEMNNMLTSLTVKLCVSNNYFTEPISVEYELVVGDGLKEGVDFKLQASTASPLVFEKGTYTKPIRIIWLNNPDFDASKDNTLTVRLSGSSISEMVLGYPGPDAIKSSFIFTKK